MSDDELIVGIDLGTTNSEIAALVDGQPRVLGPGKTPMLPSCVGISPAGQLLVGASARNQLLVYPELTVHSVKRIMGSDEKIHLGEKTFTPTEISALILRELAEWGRRQLNRPVTKAVITVPAYFSDAQRQATREAGVLAGLDVVRILNEPTAASLAYGLGGEEGRTVVVYDLGGGTFDVSIVTIEGDVTEVLASHGNNHLGGNDFDQLLLDRLVGEFQNLHGLDVRDLHPAAYSRLRWAAEEAKCKLSSEPYATVREEALARKDGRDLHLAVEFSRDQYEQMIRPLVESTLDSVTRALADAGKRPDEIDDVLLVGGSTRTPMIRDVLAQRIGVEPRQDVHPDLCVALGAGVLASRVAGNEVDRLLVDVSPYSFGPSFLGERDGMMYPYCYRPIIRRNTPLPITRTERYFTAYAFQDAVDVEVFQGDDPDALKNVLVGKFHVTDLTPTSDSNEVLCSMTLDIDGILRVTATEKRTGKSKHITISGALKPRDNDELAATQERLRELYVSRDSDAADMIDGPAWPEMIDAASVSGEADDDAPDGGEAGLRLDPTLARLAGDARALVERSRGLLANVHDDDKEELMDLHERIETAIARADSETLSAALNELREILFFIEGK